MAGKPARRLNGIRISDFVSLGVLTTTLPPPLIDEVLTATGRHSRRQRQLPAQLVIYYVIALALYGPVSCSEVLRCLIEGLRWLRRGAEHIPVACKSAITQARTRLGPEPLRRLYAAVARPLAQPGTPGAWYHGRRLVSIDGTTIDLPDTPALEDRYGRPGAAGGSSGFPQLRLVTLVETGTRAALAAVFDRYRVAEATLVRRLLDHLGPGMLCLADRGFSGFALWRKAAATGADLLWRVRGDRILPCHQALPDGSYISRVYADQRHRRHDRAGLRVRVIDYRLEGLPEAEPIYRLITTILDPALAPAAELAALYHERWEHEIAFSEIKVTLPGGRLMLRSRRPDLVEQEVYGLLLAHFALRHLMLQASAQVACDPDTLSFVHTVRVVRRQVSLDAAFPPRQRRRMHRLVLITIAEVRVEHRPRSYPRTVKRRPPSFPTRKSAAKPLKPPPSSAPTIRILAPTNLHTDDKPVAQDPRSCGKRFWWEHVRGWKRSGETRTDYCRRHALPLASFKTWVARLRHRLHKPKALI